MKKRRAFIAAIITACFAILLVLLLVWNGIIQLNNPSVKQYPVRGVDVSSYQGNIDWAVLSSQDISFAFIKATEGSAFVDPYFEYNYEQAQKTNLRIGAYHFFSYDSPGETQAANFMRTVEKTGNMLPPVIDIEFYGDKEKNIPEQSVVREQLNVFIELLESNYGMKPIIYATENHILYILTVHMTIVISG